MKLPALNIPMLVFLAMSAKIIYIGAGLGDALSLAAIAGLYAYNCYLNRKDITWMRAVEKEISDLKNSVSSVKMRQNARTMYDKNEQEKPKKRYF